MALPIARSLRSASDRLTRYILSRNERLFIRVYDRKAGLARPTRPEATDACGLDEAARRALGDLHREGFAWWRGLFGDPAFLETARAEVRDACRLVERRFEGRPDHERTMNDPETGWRLDRPVAHQGRTRITVPNKPGIEKPACVRAVLGTSALAEFVSCYYGVEAWPNYVLMERLQKAPEGDFWHFDKIYDQVKAMVLLTDVGLDNGPVRYKPATHRRPPTIDPFFHHTFRKGLSWAYPPDRVVREIKPEPVYGCGRAGDCLLMDTLGIHSGTRLIEGERLLLVVAFNVRTPKNEFLWRLGVC